MNAAIRIGHKHLRKTYPVTGTRTRSIPQSQTHLRPHLRARPLPLLARFLFLCTFILLVQLTPLSLSDIAWHGRIDYDASLLHTNTPLEEEEEYTPDEINRDLLEAVMKHGKGVSRMCRTGYTRGSHAGKWPSPCPPSPPCFRSSSDPIPSYVTRNPNSTPKYDCPAEQDAADE
ncbi:hypothetical protein FIBSPDRAFT_1050528 [Athelia psychrophila]|uniref:Uncharacterized protein n=1 Tax=Athelia psychrophila TaxID=1759441 RepID=A0A166AP44_9AGAM|nr:hypothetical protein FIBSPDRAFT_1050528 [Fibularhizoctonia sp. CBS 109695]